MTESRSPTGAAGALAAFVAACAGSAPPAGGPRSAAVERCGPVFESANLTMTGMQSLSRTTRAIYAFGRDGERAAGYLLLVRGHPLRSVQAVVGGGGRMDGPGPREHRWEDGGGAFTVRYDPGDSTIAVAGATIALDSANVVLLEWNPEDGDGPALRSAICAPALDPESLGEELLEKVPEVRAFVAPQP